MAQRFVHCIEISDLTKWGIYQIACEVISRSGDYREPVALEFKKPEDITDFVRHDDFYFFEYDGLPAVKMPSSYTDASLVESELADMGYRPLRVTYATNMVIFEFQKLH